MMRMRHRIQLRHERRNLAPAFEPTPDSSVQVEAKSPDLVEAWREVLSRMPSDVYAALKEAMPL